LATAAASGADGVAGSSSSAFTAFYRAAAAASGHNKQSASPVAAAVSKRPLRLHSGLDPAVLGGAAVPKRKRSGHVAAPPDSLAPAAAAAAAKEEKRGDGAGPSSWRQGQEQAQKQVEEQQGRSKRRRGEEQQAAAGADTKPPAATTTPKAATAAAAAGKGTQHQRKSAAAAATPAEPSVPAGLVVGRPRLTPEALALKEGDEVEFRRVLHQGRCLSGWQSGTLLQVTAGSCWEGGRRFLAQPAAAQQHAADGIHSRRASANGSSPSLSTAAMNGRSSYTPSGSGSGVATPGECVWVPLLWRGPAGGAPAAAPVVLVRLRHSEEPAVGGGGGSAAAPRKGGAQQAEAFSAGESVEVSRGGYWWPARVESAVDASGCGVLRHAAAPEGDGLVWQATGQHRIR